MLVVDRLPAGVRGELRASFETLHRMGTKIVLGLPDVLGDHERVWADWHISDSIDVVRRHYDRIWVYGDPHVFDPVVEHGLPRDLRRMTRYTGYLDGSRADPSAATRGATIRDEHGLGDGPVHVCLAGGGDDGPASPARSPARRARRRHRRRADRAVQASARAELDAAAHRRDDLRVIRVLPGADTLIWMADRVIAMGGYHTTSEALAAGQRALIVPSAHGRPDQLIRARRLENLGAADVLPAAELNQRALAAWIAADARPPAPIAGVIDTDGLSRLPSLLDELATPIEIGARRRTADHRFGRRLAAASEFAVSAAG